MAAVLAALHLGDVVNNLGPWLLAAAAAWRLLRIEGPAAAGAQRKTESETDLNDLQLLRDRLATLEEDASISRRQSNERIEAEQRRAAEAREGMLEAVSQASAATTQLADVNVARAQAEQRVAEARQALAESHEAAAKERHAFRNELTAVERGRAELDERVGLLERQAADRELLVSNLHRELEEVRAELKGRRADDS